MAPPKKSAILVVGGKITLEDTSSKAWANYLHIFEVMTKVAKTKTVTIFFESPDVIRGLLDAVPRDYLEKKYKISILEGHTEVPLKLAGEILNLAKGFDIVIRFDAIDMIFFHTGKLEILSELQITTRISALLQKMFPKIKVK